MACIDILPKKGVEIDERISNYKEGTKEGIIEGYVTAFNKTPVQRTRKVSKM